MDAQCTSKLTRRHFLAATAAGAAWAALGAPAVHAQERLITMLAWSNFAPHSDVVLDQLAQRFTKETKIAVRIDHMHHRQLIAKWAAEVESQAGHDIGVLRMHFPWLYANHLLDVSDIAEELEKKHGPWYDFAKEVALVDGVWRAVPYYYASFPCIYREDLFQQVEEPVPQTYDDLLRAGRKLKKLGHPAGFAMSQAAYDGISTLSTILWSFGSRPVAADGKTVTLNSPETVEALEWVKAFYNEAMTEEVLSWDDGSNNRFIASGRGSWIHNPISAYVVPKRKNMPIVEKLNFHVPPAGPRGERHTVTIPRSVGIWKWTKDPEAAREFVRYLFRDDVYSEYIMAGDNFNHPIFRDMENHEVWNIDPKYKVLKELGKISHIYGWPAPPTEKSQLVTNKFILPIMAAKAVTGTPIKEAIAWAEAEIKKIYAA
ncbi:MAG: ABC transporter substrate-binding protein [Candidatus Tectimicrobiota bacterium]|nr:MAG: ABC transporter substrate-binding protein [Candidatus Tectomicrobia bacterium]